MRLTPTRLVCKAGLAPAIHAQLGTRPNVWGTWKLTQAQYALACRLLGLPAAPAQEVPAPGELRPYQREAHAFLDDLGGSGYIEHAPGLGKTRTTLEYLHDRERLARSLVVCPKVVRHTWRREAERWLRITPTIIEEPSDFERPGPWVVHWEKLAISKPEYDAAGRPVRDGTGQHLFEFPFLDAARRAGVDTVVFDEMTRAKTPSALRSRAALVAAQAAQHRIGLSGYPMPHAPTDLWMQYHIIRPDDRQPLGFRSPAGIEAVFANRVPAYRGAPRAHKKIVGWKPEGLAELGRRWAEIAHRKTKADAAPDLPEKLYQQVWVELSARERKAYDAMARDAVAFIEKTRRSGRSFREKLVAEHLLTQMIRLHQIAGGYAVGHAKSAKLAALLDYVEDIPRPFVVFAAYTQAPCSEVEAIATALTRAKLKAATLYGNTSDRERDRTLDTFARGEIDALVAHPATGGIGLNLQNARYCIWYSETYNQEHWVQGCDRVHRLGIVESPTIVSLTAERTIDEKIVSSREAKTTLAQMLVDAPEEVFT